MKPLYSVLFKKSAQKELVKLAPKIQARVLDAISFLRLNPYSENLNIKKLKGADFLYRLRVGDYRVVYEVNENVLIITVIKLGHRKEVYR